MPRHPLPTERVRTRTEATRLGDDGERPRLAHRPRTKSPTRLRRGSPLRSRVVQVHNMIDRNESLTDQQLPVLEADVKAECEASGTVRRVVIVPNRAVSERAVVYVEFERVADAIQAIASLNNADVGGSKVPTTASMLSEPSATLPSASTLSEAEFDRISNLEADRRRRCRHGSQMRHHPRTSSSAALARRLAHDIPKEPRAALLEDDADLASAFDRVDKDGDGYVTASQFRRGLRLLTDKGMTADDLDLLMEEFGTNGDSKIDYAEFIAALRRSARAEQIAGELHADLRKRLRHNKDGLLCVLDELDTTEDGELTASDVRRVLRQQGLTTADADQLMRLFAARGADRIDFAEFLEALYDAGSSSLHRSTSSSPHSSRSVRLQDRSGSSLEFDYRRRLDNRLTVVHIRDYIRPTSRSIRKRDFRQLEEEVEHEMAEYGAVTGVLIVIPAASTIVSHSVETYVHFATETAAKQAQKALTAERYQAVLLEEEEYKQIEEDDGRRGTYQHGRTSSDTSLESETREDREAKAKHLAQVIGKDLREVFPKGFDLRNTFRFMDKNGDNKLSHDELKTGLLTFTDRRLSDKQLRQIVDMFDANGDGDIDYREFCDIFDAYDRAESTAKDVLHHLLNQLQSYSNQADADLRQVFKRFDTNGDGKLSRDEFQRGLQSFSIDLDSSQMDDVMKALDEDGDGEIDLSEFLSSTSPMPRTETFDGTKSSAPLCGVLEVRVVKCTNLLPRKGKTIATPCVKMSIGQGDDKQEYKSEYQRDTLDPVFYGGNKAVFQVRDDGKTARSNELSTLVVQVCDWQLLWRDTVLGEVDLDLRREFGESWIQCEQRKHQTWVLKNYDRRNTTHARRPSESYGIIELEMKYSPTRASATLQAKVIGCKNLIPLDRIGGRSNPYVKVDLLQGQNYEDVQSFQTSTIPKTLDPVFSQDKLQVLKVDKESYEAGRCWLRLTVYNYNKDHVQKKDFGGVALVDIRERFSGQWPKAAQKLPFRQAFNLEDSDNQILVPDNRKHQSTRYGTVEVQLDLVGGSVSSSSSILSCPEPEPEPEPELQPIRVQPCTADVPTEPVCLIWRDGGTLRIHSDGRLLLEALGEAPVAVVAINGLGRTGKSYLLNQLLGRDSGATGKGFGTDMDSTSGIWCCLVPPDVWYCEKAPNTRLLLLDTESLRLSPSSSSRMDGISWDMQWFSLSVLLSSLLVYTSMGEVNDSAIEQLYMVKELTQHIRISAAPDAPRLSRQPVQEETLAHLNPEWMWLLRDFPEEHFRTTSESKASLDSGELQYHLDESLEERSYHGRARTTSGSTITRIREQNQTRAAFRQLFPTHCCRALVRPVVPGEDLSGLSALPIHSLRTDFIRQVQDLCGDIRTMVKPKMLFGESVCASRLSTLLRFYVDDLNHRRIIDVRKAWDAAMDSSRALQGLYLAAREHYEVGMEKLCAVEDIYKYKCVHPAEVTESNELGSHPQVVAQIEDGETIEALEQHRIDLGPEGGFVDRLRTHCGWVSKEAGNKRLFVELGTQLKHETITLKQTRQCLKNVDRILKGTISGVSNRNAKRKKAQELCQAIWNDLDDELLEAKTLEWTEGRVAQVTKLLGYLGSLKSYDVREEDFGRILLLLQELSDLRWHAPTDNGEEIHLRSAKNESSGINNYDFFTTILQPPFGFNIGHNCEVLNFNATPDGRQSAAEAAGVLPGMTIVEVNGTPVRGKHGIHAAIKHRSANALLKFRNVPTGTSSTRARYKSTSAASGRMTPTPRFGEEAELRRTQVGDVHGRQQRRLLPTRDQFDERHWQLTEEAAAMFERSASVATSETVLRWRQKLDRELKEIYRTELQKLERDSRGQCQSLIHDLCEGLVRRVQYGCFDFPHGEPHYHHALEQMMDVYEREATRRGGPLKDQVAREAITGELPRVYKAFMERQMETETTKNRALEAVLERMFESGIGHDDDLATYRRHRYPGTRD